MTMSDPWQQGEITPADDLAAEAQPAQPAPAAETESEALREIRAARNEAAALRRIVERTQRESTQRAEEDRTARERLEARLEAESEARKLESMTDDERADHYRAQLEEERKARTQPAADVQVDRSDPYIQSLLGGHFDDAVTDEIREYADDIGFAATPETLRVFREAALSDGPDGVPIRRGVADWDGWIKNKVKPTIRAEIKRMAAEAAGKAPRKSAALPGQGALGDASRANAGGPGGMNWAQAQKIKNMNDMSDAEYERLVAGGR